MPITGWAPAMLIQHSPDELNAEHHGAPIWAFATSPIDDYFPGMALLSAEAHRPVSMLRRRAHSRHGAHPTFCPDYAVRT